MNFYSESLRELDVIYITYRKSCHSKYFQDWLQAKYSSQGLTDATRTTAESWDTEDGSFSHDANGNLISQSGKFTNIAYDHRNLPVRFTTAASDTVLTAYNIAGRRILKESSGGGW